MEADVLMEMPTTVVEKKQDSNKSVVNFSDAFLDSTLIRFSYVWRKVLELSPMKLVEKFYCSKRTFIETPLQFIDCGYHSFREPIDGHGNPMAPIPGLRSFSDGPWLIKGKFGEKIVKTET